MKKLFNRCVNLIRIGAAGVEPDGLAHHAQVSTVGYQVACVATEVDFPVIVCRELPSIGRDGGVGHHEAVVLGIPGHLLCGVSLIPAVEAAHKVHVGNLRGFQELAISAEGRQAEKGRVQQTGER